MRWLSVPSMAIALSASGALGAQERVPTGETSSPGAPAIPSATAGSPALPDAACLGQRISSIEISPRAPYQGNGQRWWSAPLRAVNRMHVTTQPEIIRGFLLLREGDACVEWQRAESERILRAQPYLADARITAAADGEDGVVLRVVTVDELTPIAGVYASAESPWLEGLKLGDGNLGGRGMLLSAGWREGVHRAHFEGRVIDYQFLGRSRVLELSGARRDVGYSEFGLGLSLPFYTDLQKVAWRLGVTRRNEIFDFYRGDEEPLALSLRNEYVTLGGIVRVGSPGRLSLFGLAFTGERSHTGPPPVEREVDGVDYQSIANAFGGRRSARLNVLWGFRSLNYLRVERFDALTAAQDVARGFQLGAVLGRSMGVLGSHDNDLLIAADVYAGRGDAQTFVSLHARGEARDNYAEGLWDGILASATLAANRRLHPRHMLVLTANWSAGWRQRVPFQLPLGSTDGGVRGFGDSRDAGGRRAVVSLEDRWYLGTPRGQADLGLAFFVDAGAVRAGDAPLGTDSPVRVGAGVGLLAALPPGSRRTWRLELAAPVNRDRYARWEIRLSSTNVRGGAWREPPEVTRSREQAVPVGLFSWPR